MTTKNLINDDLSPYDQLYKCVLKAYGSKPYLVIVAVVSAIVSVLIATINSEYGTNDFWNIFLLSCMVTFFLGACLLGLYQSLGYSVPETTLIQTATEFVLDKSFTDYEIENILVRAEISSNTSPVKNLFPILAIPIAISIALTQDNMSVLDWLGFGFGIVVLLLPLALDTKRTTVDGIIRHATANYIYHNKKQIDENHLLVGLLSGETLIHNVTNADSRN